MIPACAFARHWGLLQLRPIIHRSLEMASSNDLSDLKLKFDYMIVIYLNCRPTISSICY